MDLRCENLILGLGFCYFGNGTVGDISHQIFGLNSYLHLRIYTEQVLEAPQAKKRVFCVYVVSSNREKERASHHSHTLTKLANFVRSTG